VSDHAVRATERPELCHCDVSDRPHHHKFDEIRGERIFVPVDRDPDEPHHTCVRHDYRVPTLKNIIGCPGCQWQVQKAAAFYEEHPEFRPDWMVQVMDMIVRGPKD
jgi:hypothetical protein